MLTEKQARRAGIEAGSYDAEELFRETDAEDRARVASNGWGWSASEAATILQVPAQFRRAFEEGYEREATSVWADLVEDAEREDAEREEREEGEDEEDAED